MNTDRWSAPELAARPANFTQLTPLSFLARAAKIYHDRTAIVYGDERQTWREFAATCRQFASALTQAGIGRGDVVAFMMCNTPPTVAAHFAVPMAGAVLNTINTRLDVDTVEYILQHCKARVLVVDAEFVTLARSAMQEMRNPPRMLVYADRHAGFSVPPGADDFAAFVAGGDPTAAGVLPDDEWSPISINYTSGTTGRPKGVVYSHRGAYLASVSSIVNCALPKRLSYLWTLPLFHCNGWCMAWALALQGGKNVCLRKVDAPEIVRLIAAEDVTHYSGAPIVHALIRDEAQRLARVFNPPIAALIGGAPPPASLLASMEALGVHLTHAYGLTETYGPAAMCEEQPEWDALSDSARADLKARQGVAYALQDDVTVLHLESAGTVPADGVTMGEIALRGNIAMMGYLDDPFATERVFADGWFRSGDLAVLEPDGYIRIKDRSKDIIISGGENISSVEVENVLYAHPQVISVAVIARPDDRWGEVPMAVVEMRDGPAVTEAELIAFCRARLAHFKCPKQIVFGTIPKTATGKIQKNLLRASIQS